MRADPEKAPLYFPDEFPDKTKQEATGNEVKEETSGDAKEETKAPVVQRSPEEESDESIALEETIQKQEEGFNHDSGYDHTDHFLKHMNTVTDPNYPF